MRYIYIIHSLSTPGRFYPGITRDFHRRLNEHNEGKSTYTSKYLPWEPVVTVRFQNDKAAYQFEKYLKSGSGRAFAKKHFVK